MVVLANRFPQDTGNGGAPYAASQGKPYIAGAAGPGVSIQVALLTLAAGANTITLSDDNPLKPMRDGTYAVIIADGDGVSQAGAAVTSRTSNEVVLAGAAAGEAFLVLIGALAGEVL